MLIKISTNKYRKALFLFCFSIFSFHVFSNEFNFSNYNTEDGLPQSYVYSIIQDDLGYLWIGTGDGLSRYNGFTFENFTTNDSLADNFITCAINDGKKLWFGHMNGGLTYYDGKMFHTVKLLQSDQGPITHFAKSPDGQVWTSTYADGILKMDKETGKAQHYRFKNQSLITSFEFLDNNTFIIGTNTGLLYCRLKGYGEIEIIRQISEIPEAKVVAIHKMRNNHGFYIATENEGVFQLSSKDNQIKVSQINLDKDIDFSGVQHIYEDSHSNLWLATFGNGLVKLNTSGSGKFTKIEYLNKTTEFATDNVKYIFEDREGIIWSGNYGEGLTQITPKEFSVNVFDGNYGNEIYSIYIDPQFRWIGTGNGLVKTELLTDKILEFYGNGLPKDIVTSIYSKDGKEIWIGTENSGVFRLMVNERKIIKFPLNGGNLENSITCIAGKGEQVWIGTKKGLCNVNTANDAQKWYSINRGGLPHNFINCLFIDSKGKLWVSTQSNTLCYIKNEKVIKIPLNQVSRNITFGPITEDSRFRIWVGSNGQGVFILKSDSIKNLTLKNGLLSDYCYSIINDNDNNIWVGHKGGLSKIKTNDFSIKPIQQIDANSGAYQFNPNAIFKEKQDRIWFGSHKGLICYDPSKIDAKLMPPVLSITSVKINDEDFDFTDNIVLSPGTYKIKFEFIGISLKDPELVSYQYKLEGYDQWSEITKDKSITFSHLMDGEYTFMLKAYSADGVVSEYPLKINITIKKPIWKKWWFYLLSFLSFTILIYFYIKQREKKLLTEKRILEEKVTERTLEIQQQKNEIETQRDIIEQKNANITSSIKYASNIQNAIFPPIEFINRLLPDNFILTKPKEIVSGDFYWLAEKGDKIMFAVADCTGHGVPGAFMSILGVNLLNEIVNQGIIRSDMIVTTLRERLIDALQQGRKDMTTLDGMDISLCVLDKNEKKVQFTGGMNNLVHISNNKMNIIKADRLTVSSISDNSRSFTLNEFTYSKGDLLYLFSDGYRDQFGGPEKKKYLIRQLNSFLFKIHALPMAEQKELLLKENIDWMGNSPQTDDITVMGVRLY
jgi:ligand-binding sensor domain-containing protein/serine phosphatase RsbU (regulator of sigma subunit)